MEPKSSSPHLQAHATCPYPVHKPTSHFPKIHLNIILPSTSWSPQWPLSLRFPHQNPVRTSPLPHTRYMPRPSHSGLFCLQRNHLAYVFRNKGCLRIGVVSTSPNPQAGGSPRVGCPRLLIQYIRSYPPNWRPFLQL
jgi:hypothetical protein